MYAKVQKSNKTPITIKSPEKVSSGVTTADPRPYLPAKDVARQLKVSTNTIRLWTDKGLLPCETALGGHQRFLRTEVEKIMKTQSADEAKKSPSILICEDDVDLAQTIAEGAEGCLLQPLRIKDAPCPH